MTETGPLRRAEIVVDLDTIRRNVERLRALVAPTPVMVVVKADGYGHGMVAAASAARAGGAAWLGVADAAEAIALREAGDTGPLLAWLGMPGEDLAPLIAAHVDVAAYTVAQLQAIADAARRAGRIARAHLKIDTGLSRGGATAAQWPALVAEARRAQEAGVVGAVGVWSHFACSDEPEHPANEAQERAFRAAIAVAEDAGLAVGVRHLSNSAGALWRPSARFDLVRFGIAAYGLSPNPAIATAAELELTPAMTVRARAALAKQIAAGDGVSYGHTYRAAGAERVALVPLGYGDGIPRHASNSAQVQLAGERCPVRGRICMDQFVVSAPQAAAAGDEVVLFSDGADGAPTAEDWALWCETISYEIVTRMGGLAGRAERRWLPLTGGGVR